MSRNFELLQRLEVEERAHQGQQGARPVAETTAADLPHAQTTSLPPYSTSRVHLDPSTREEVLKLGHRLFVVGGAPRAVVFAGINQGDGSSWITARTAEALASHVSGLVCVVDGNLRCPVLHEEFGVANHHGLTDALLHAGPIKSFTQPLGGSNLSLLSCGSLSVPDKRVLNSNALRARLTELRNEFDHILIDAPPLRMYSDGAMLGHLADGIVIVLQAHSTHREAARRAAKDLASANVRVLGAVLNKRTFPIPDFLYSKL